MEQVLPRGHHPTPLFSFIIDLCSSILADFYLFENTAIRNMEEG
ncbi:hypothetical protein IMCC1989_1577 [gamma proteobacterium IMCC1989]|nr:hypothetical protein IMCC1989_1577 [gamma proteobacterium IMCC1989]